MKKLTIVLMVFGLTIVTANAQWFNTRVKGNQKMTKEIRQVQNYDDIAVAGSFDVKLVSGKEGKIAVNADENLLPYLITEVDNQSLKIKWKEGFNISHSGRILIEVPIESISKLALAGSGDIFTNSFTLKEATIKVNLAGSGNIKIAVNADELSAAISGSGNIDLVGSANTFKASIAGSGDINSYDLLTKDANLKIAGSGGIKTNVSNFLNVSISGSGDIYYKGNPKQDIKISGSGSVKSKE